jgi:hypothetical protein
MGNNTKDKIQHLRLGIEIPNNLFEIFSTLIAHFFRKKYIEYKILVDLFNIMNFLYLYIYFFIEFMPQFVLVNFFTKDQIKHKLLHYLKSNLVYFIEYIHSLLFY